MTLPQALPECGASARWPKIAAAAWVLLISAIAIVNSVGLSRLAESRSNTQDIFVQTLDTRVGDIERQAEALKRLPKPITQADFDAARQALEQRLSQLEQVRAVDTRTGDIQALQARMGVIENRLQKTSPSAATAPRRPAKAVTPQVPEPPFVVVGLELRGGERFLVITAPAATSLAGARLLREGDTEGGWRLQSIEARAAVFQVNGQTQRVAVP